jgi:hypothetical protein
MERRFEAVDGESGLPPTPDVLRRRSELTRRAKTRPLGGGRYRRKRTSRDYAFP